MPQRKEGFPGQTQVPQDGEWAEVKGGMGVVKNLPAMQETQEAWVQSLHWEDPLEKEMAAHSSTLAWEIPWTEEPDGLQSMGSPRGRQH